jgi:pimeloyl-ACP methyl ester carboxylesterase
VLARPVVTERGTFATLDNLDAFTDPPIGSAVLVPGFTGSKEDFIALLTPLAERGVRGIALDLSGQYETGGPAGTEHYSLAGFSADVWAVAGTLPRPLALVGHSFGGLVVRDAVLADPLRADGLVIIASGPAALPEEQQAVLRRFVDVMSTHGIDAVWKAKRVMDAAAGAPAVAPDVDTFLTRRFLASSPGSLQAMIETLCGAGDQVEALATVAPATTVIVGEHDDVWRPHDQRAMAERLGAAIVELPGVGHSPAVEAPDVVADAVARLLTDDR